MLAAALAPAPAPALVIMAVAAAAVVAPMKMACGGVRAVGVDCHWQGTSLLCSAGGGSTTPRLNVSILANVMLLLLMVTGVGMVI